MFVELHMIQNFAPSNLNRDDTGSPKDCEFGGYRRARISSQCLKRSVRRDSGFLSFLDGKGGVRTRRLVVEIAERIAGVQPAPQNVVKVVAEVFAEGGLDRPKVARDQEAEKDNTKLILFVDRPAIDAMTDHFKEQWDGLQKGSKEDKAKVREALSEILANAVKSPDIALFGRMIEIDPQKPFGKLQLGVDAACQVAHAFSTHKVSMEFDYYTAVDDLQPKGEVGAGMIGTVEFNSACYYRYANVDLGQLRANLGGDVELAERTLKAFLRASVAAIPTGKQNSMAAQNPPSLVFAVVRDAGLWSLANAFVKPVWPGSDGDLVQRSIEKLDDYWGGLTRMYGECGIRGKWVALLEEGTLQHLATVRVDSVDALIADVLAKVRADGASAEVA